MTHVHSQTVQHPLGGCLIAVVTDTSENIWPGRIHIMNSVKLSWPALSRQTSGPGNRMDKNEGVHNVHTLGFGGSYWYRTGPDCGGFRGSGGN